MPAWEFQMMQSIARKHGWHEFISMQNYYNPIYREEEREMIPFCKASGVGLIPVSTRLESVINQNLLTYFTSGLLLLGVFLLALVTRATQVLYEHRTIPH
jgi:hypothetical protein